MRNDTIKANKRESISMSEFMRFGNKIHTLFTQENLLGPEKISLFTVVPPRKVLLLGNTNNILLGSFVFLFESFALKGRNLIWILLDFYGHLKRLYFSKRKM